jgi:hypothetical protein
LFVLGEDTRRLDGCKCYTRSFSNGE